MKRLAALIIALVAWLAAAPAFAAITVTQLGTQISASSNTSITLTTTTNDCPVGSYVVVALGIAASSGWGISDGLGNTYVNVNHTYNTNHHNVLIYGRVATDVAIGTVLTISWTTGAREAAIAVCVSGLAASTPLDATGGGYDASTSPVTGLSTGVLAQNSEIVFGVWGNTAGIYGTWTEDGAFTSETIPTPGTNENVRLAHDIVSSTSSVSYGPSWTTATHPVGAQVWSFKAAGGVLTCRGALLLLGVGGC